MEEGNQKVREAAETAAPPGKVKKTVDIVLPVYHPGKAFEKLLKGLKKQKYPIGRIIIMKTGREGWKAEYEELFREQGAPKMEVHFLEREEFDHGRTRDQGIGFSDADVCLLMTQDAVPGDRELVGNLVKALESEPGVAAAYGRQLPLKDCSPVERCARAFNYPEESCVKSLSDLPRLGIKTYFCSNVCAAYDRAVYRQLGGFIKRTIFNEDMIFAAGAIKAGYGIAYAADAQVFHSHNYTPIQQLQRNFDLAVSQADHPEVFSGLRSEGEGLRLVKRTAASLVRQGKWYLLPELAVQSGFKYLGFFLGKRYRRLPKAAVMRLTMNKSYWEQGKH